jgi:Fur family zinc uptake transcriptional regulator
LRGCLEGGLKSEKQLAMKSSGERLAWALKHCERTQMRMTSVRKAILEFLSEQRKPVNLDAVSRIRGVRDQWDATTVYRTLMIFKDAGLVRCVGMLRRTSHFVLNVPDDVSHFLICERCGAVVELDLSREMLGAMERLALEHGFSASGQCMDIHGICRACEEAARRTVPGVKVMARHCFV